MGTLKFAPQERGGARTLAFRGASNGLDDHEIDGPELLSPESRVDYARSTPGSAINLARGGRISFSGASETPVTIVHSGWVALFRSLPGNRSICVGLLGPGDLFLRDDEGHEVIAEALTDSRLLQEDLRRIVEAMSGSPAAVQAALMSLRRQTTELQELVARLLSRDITLRLAAVLLTLSDHFGEPQDDHTVAIGIPVAHKMLARMIGSNRVTVTRVMSEMREAGMVRAPRRNVVVVDPRLLRLHLTQETTNGAWSDELDD